MDELQELREQMAALKEKLNKQQIVTEQNLRQLIRKKIQNWRVFFIVWTILMPLFIYGEYMYYDSWLRTIAWGMFFVIWLCTNLYTFLSLNNKNIMSGNVTELLSKMQRLKRIEKGPMVLLGFVFFIVVIMGEDFVELCQKYPFDSTMTMRCEPFGMRKNSNGGSLRLILWLLLQKVPIRESIGA